MNDFVPTPDTDVFTFTPAPIRWKLWMFDLSRTVSLYVPAFFGLTGIVIVNPGPSTPLITGVAATAGSARTSAAAAARTTSLAFNRSPSVASSTCRWYASADGQRPVHRARVRVADERVRARLQVDGKRLRAGGPDVGGDVHARAGEVEVVARRLIVDGQGVCP